MAAENGGQTIDLRFTNAKGEEIPYNNRFAIAMCNEDPNTSNRCDTCSNILRLKRGKGKFVENFYKCRVHFEIGDAYNIQPYWMACKKWCAS